MKTPKIPKPNTLSVSASYRGGTLKISSHGRLDGKELSVDEGIAFLVKSLAEFGIGTPVALERAAQHHANGTRVTEASRSVIEPAPEAA